MSFFFSLFLFISFDIVQISRDVVLLLYLLSFDADLVRLYELSQLLEIVRPGIHTCLQLLILFF